MGSFSVNMSRLGAREATLSSLSKKLNNIAGNNALSRNDANVAGLSSTLSAISTEISALSKSVGSLGTAVGQIASAYSSSESSLISNSGRVAGGPIFSFASWDTTDKKDSYSWEGQLLQWQFGGNTLNGFGAALSASHSFFGKDKVEAYLANFNTDHTENYFLKFTNTTANPLRGSLDSQVDLFGNRTSDLEDYLRDQADKHGKDWFDDNLKEYYDKNGNRIKKEDAPNFYKKKATIADAEVISESLKASLYEGTFKPADGTEIGVTVGEAEAHIKGHAGLYVVGDDGTSKFSPGVSGEIGASVTALSASWAQQIVGDENLGLSSDVNVTAGEASAKVSGAAQLYGENGKLQPQLGVSASAEAIAAEVSGNVDVNILGGEVGVKGSVNFGVGAHADLGFKDGVVKVDLGASLGVGVSVGFEADIGGAVNTVVSGAESAWNDVTDAASDAWSEVTSWF